MTSITVHLQVPGGSQKVNIQLRGNFEWNIDENGALEIEPEEEELRTYVFNWDHVLYFEWTDE